jgi:hypothetical protein
METKIVTVEAPGPDDAWVLDVMLANVRGRVTCVGLTIKPSSQEPTDELTSRTLRKITLRQTLTAIRRDADPQLETIMLGKRTDLGVSLGDLAEVGLGPLDKGVNRRGPKPRPISELKKAAKAYIEAPASPRMAVAETMNVSPSSASKIISRCRELGLIGPTTQGKPSARSE